MIVKTIIDEDFNNYKKPAMLIGFPYCTFKCERDYGEQVCQNSILATTPSFKVEVDDIVERYKNNCLTNSLVCGGLEPFDSFDDLFKLISAFRKVTDDDVIIFTGYNRYEIYKDIYVLKRFKNIIVKFGRYIPNQVKHLDEILGVYLASDNQYAERIS